MPNRAGSSYPSVPVRSHAGSAEGGGWTTGWRLKWSPSPTRPLSSEARRHPSADMKAFSRLMEADEEATLRTLQTYRAAIDVLISRHDGRVVGTAGDSVLAEFMSPVEAARCAAEIQDELARRNAALSPDRRLEFRIGINLGDVIVDGADLFGNGVNIAARLQALATRVAFSSRAGFTIRSGPTWHSTTNFSARRASRTSPSRCGSIGSTAIPPPHLRAGKRGADGAGR